MTTATAATRTVHRYVWTTDLTRGHRVAQRTATEVDQLDIGLTLEQAYDVQRAVIARRAGRGERVVGVELGFTSAAKMAQMGISEIIDSRYRSFRFSLPDVVADNTSAAAYVIRSRTPVAQAGELGELAVRLVVDGNASLVEAHVAGLGVVSVRGVRG